MFKKILTLILALTFVPAVSFGAQEDTIDASVFADNAEYLLQEHFAQHFAAKVGGTSQSLLSGWDVDYRGGRALVKENGLEIRDASQQYAISMCHDILPVTSGELTFETALSFNSCMDMLFSAELLGDGASAMKLNFYDGKICAEETDGNEIYIDDYAANQKIYIKASISLKNGKISLYINNNSVQLNIPQNCTSVNGVSLYTGEKEECYGNIYFVNVYKNYIVNERFMTAPQGSVPCDFDLTNEQTGSQISYAPGSAYNDDQNGFLLKNTEQTPDVSLKKSFANNSSKITVSWTMLLPQKQDGVYVRLMQKTSEEISVYTDGGNIYAKSYAGSVKLKENYRGNLWYNFNVDINAITNTFDISVNYKKVCENVKYSGGIIDNIIFSKNASSVGEVIIDDITVCRTFKKYTDYPSEPVVPSQDGVNTGMVMYPMWREGIHYGWDAISPYSDERKPLLGYYTEGQREVSDWQNKWLIEHGVDYALYPFVRPSSDSGEPVKKPTRGEDLNDGYMNSEYSSKLKFAILLSAFSTENYHGADEFIENVIPYLSEYYFTDPRYMKINNKLPVFGFSLVNMAEKLGGASELKKVIKALRAEAKRLGCDDIIFAADAATPSGHAMVEKLDEDVRIWNYGTVTDEVDCIKQKIDEQYGYSEKYIPSISMGYDTTPWRTSECGVFSPDDIRSICKYVKQKNDFNASDDKMVLFTCWNEYGEGHYFAPTAKYGFDYLNVIRDEFTNAGTKTDEQTPSAASLARMSVFYPNGRGALKTKNDRMFTSEDMQKRDLLYRFEFNSENSLLWTTNNCTAKYSNGNFECVATKNDPQIYFQVDTGVDISKVKAVKIRARVSSGTSGLRLFYTTTDNTEYGEGKMFCTDRFSSNSEYKEFILYPYGLQSGITYPASTGTIISFRIDPSDDIYLGNKDFGIDWFELYGDNTNTGLIVDGESANLTTAPVVRDGTVYIPIYSVLLNEMKAYALWNEQSKTLLAHKNGNTLSVTADSNTATVNGSSEIWEHTPFYEKGNLFVPYKEFLSKIGYAAEYDETTNTVSCTSKPTQVFSAIATANEFGGNIARSFQSTNVNDFSYYRLPEELNVETVDNRRALKLVPETAGSDSLFSIAYVNYNGKRCRLNEVVADGKQMKLTFSCKGVCDKVVVENREGSKRQPVNPEITDISPDAWGTYSLIFDNNGIEVADGDVRWLTFRIKSNSAQEPYLYISDLKLQCLEEAETSKYDTTIKFRITTPVNCEEAVPYQCMIAEYADDGTLISCITALSGNTGESGEYTRYYPYTPKEGSTVKIFLWNDMYPLCKTSVITPTDKN